ncbi:hypothetical protein [Acuticoccus sp.]|uniref:hypothetical protein n=1 Tax=Acuticoccus sp. TaxID=1904378 RepID=UPI003B52E0EA
MSKEQDVQVEILRKARRDPDFRAELKADPKAALQAHFGIEVSDEIDIEIVEKKDWRSVVLVLPPLDETVVEASQLAAEANVSTMCTTSVPGGTCWLPTVNAPTCRGCK